MAKLEDLKVGRHTRYTHITSICDMQAALASQLKKREELKDKILESCKFSTTLDESTDVSVHLMPFCLSTLIFVGLKV